MTKEERPTFHGVEIPEDVWLSWNDPNSTEASAWQRGVADALKPRPAADMKELGRLEQLAEAQDEAERRAFEDANKDQPWMQRRLAFRKAMRESDG